MILRRTCSGLLLALVAAWSTGLTLQLHERLEGGHHDTQHCATCQQLTTGKSAVVSSASPIFAPHPGTLILRSAPQRPVLCLAIPSVSPRAPPLA